MPKITVETGKFSEPWHSFGGCIGTLVMIGENKGLGNHIAQFADPRKAKRARECVNALAGFNPRKVRRVLKAAPKACKEVARDIQTGAISVMMPAVENLSKAVAQLKGEE